MPKTNPKKKSLPVPKRTSKNSDLFALVEEEKKGEAQAFDRYVKGPSKKEIVRDSLSDLYSDDKGERINVQEVNIKRRRSIWGRLGIALLYSIAAAVVIWAGWKWFASRQNATSPLALSLKTDSVIIANQEFTYTIDYQNQENIVLNNVELVVVYPENFIFSESSPMATSGNNKWSLGEVKAFGSGRVQIRGRLLSPPGQSNILFADITYQPAGITSSFKKSASVDIIVAASGIDVVATAPGSLLVGEEKPLEISWLLQEKHFLDRFKIRVKTSDHLAVRLDTTSEKGVTSEGGGVWAISPEEAKSLPLLIKAVDKGSDEKETITVLFEYAPEDGDRSYVIEEKSIPLEIIKNSLNLSLTINGQNTDQGVDFGQVINYSISYANKGETTMNNVIISAVLDGDALDWSEVDDQFNGKIVGSSLVWTPVEIPALASLQKNQQGKINFSIPVRPANEGKLLRQLEIKNYAQFSLTEDSLQSDEKEAETSTESNRSNQIILKINSDTELSEAVRYFTPDNMAVGTGPLPPEVGQTTTLKVYWSITNSLHELGNTRVITTLPSGVTWDGKEVVSVGSLSYNPNTKEVVWEIGRLPVSVPEITAEFSIALTPRASDRNRLMILVSGTAVNAQDNQTGFTISKTLKAQTTKLEQDQIANTDGIVR